MPELTLGAVGTERQKPPAPVRPPRPVLRDREPLVRLEPALGAAHDAQGLGTAPVRRISWILHGSDPNHSPPVRRGVGRANRCPARRPRPATSGSGHRSSVVRVREVEAATRLPQRALLAVRRYAARVLQEPREMEQVPRHERGVAVGEVVLRAARAGVEIGRARPRLPDPACVRLRRDRVAQVLERVEDPLRTRQSRQNGARRWQPRKRSGMCGSRGSASGRATGSFRPTSSRSKSRLWPGVKASRSSR